MRASGWMRKWRPARALDRHEAASVRSAARGDSLDQLLGAAVQELLATAGADRAGLWLAEKRPGELGRGRVVDSAPGPVPDRWKYLDITTPLLRAARESSEPLRVESDSEQTLPQLGPQVGMTGAIWIPLRLRDRTLGLAMAGYARAHAASRLDLDILRAYGERIALSIAHCRETRQRELEAEESRALVRLSRAILCDVSVDSIFPQIVRAARQHRQAVFVILGRRVGTPMLAEAWEGPEEWRNLIQQEPLLGLWHTVLMEGHGAELGGDVLPVLSSSLSGQTSPALDRVIGLPIEVRNQVCGVMVAGFAISENAGDDTSRLESYALLAASALDREAARIEQKEGASSLRQIVEESGEYLFAIDGRGLIREASRAACAFLRLELNFGGRLPFEDLFSPEAHKAVSEWHAGFVRQTRGPAPAAEPLAAPLEVTLASGTFVRLHLRSRIGSEINDTRRWLVYFEDYAYRKAQREETGRLEAELTGLMDSIDSGVLLLDVAGNIRVASDRLAQIMGMEAHSLRDLGTIDALIDSFAGRFHHPLDAAARWRDHVQRGNEASWDELELERPSRKIVERFTRPLLDRDGARVGWLEVYRDITGQRLIQSKLLQTEKMAALGQLVSGIAHELNNPLTSIQGYAQLLVSRRSASDRAADTQRISQEAARAARIVRNLLLFSREAKPERHTVNLNDVIERTIALRAYELRIENIGIDLSFDAALPQTMADAAQLQQVVLNLIVNAEQAIQEGRAKGGQHGRIHIRTRRLSGDRIGMEISDDGPGISPEIVSRIFDPFFTTKSVGVGTGLGLSIVYGIVQEHGGEVSVESQPGRGVSLTIELPALPTAAFLLTGTEPTAARAVAVVPAPRTVRSSYRPERILVVEDEPTVLQLIVDVMSEEGLRVDALLDSRKAFEQLKEKEYDLIVCDVKMPRLDGPSLYRELVRRGSPMQHRLLFVTGDTMSPRTLEFLHTNGLRSLAKPFLVEELKEAVWQTLASVPASAEAVVRADWTPVIARKK